MGELNKIPCVSFSPKLVNGLNLVALMDGVVLTTAVISTLRDNAILPGLWQLISACLLVLQTDDVPNKDDIATVGSELMKGTEGGQADICIKDQDGAWALEPVRFNDCGGSECCR